MSEYIMIPLTNYFYQVVEIDYECHSVFLTTLDMNKAHKFYVKMRAAYIANGFHNGSGCMYDGQSLILDSPYSIEQIELDKEFPEDYSDWMKDQLKWYEEEFDKKTVIPCPEPRERDLKAIPTGLFSGVYKMKVETEAEAEEVVDQYSLAQGLVDNLSHIETKTETEKEKLKAKKDWI
jgi:hypothetical protein